MNKLLMAAILLAGLSQASWAQTVEERLLSGLESQGYTVIEKGYTFLGRLRIVAENDEIHREIVVNPGTGEILRDYAIYLSDMPQGQPIMSQSKVASHGSAGSSGRTASTAHVALGGADPTGTAGVAVSSLAPGSSTLGTANLQVDKTMGVAEILLDTTILPMSTGAP